MRFMTAALSRLAGTRPQGLRVIFASMARQASLEEDLWARASYVEGLLGYKPGSLLRNNRALFTEASDALEAGEPNRITEHLLHERGMSDQEAKALLGPRDRKLPEALRAGIRKGMPAEGVRGISPDGVFQSVAMGLSPVTLDPFPQYKGGNVFWFLGRSKKDTPTLGGIAYVLTEHGKLKAMDVVKGTHDREKGQGSFQDPVPGADSNEAVLEDIFAGDSAVSRADYIEMAESVFASPSIMGRLDRAVRGFLKGPAQISVWDVVRENPHLIRVKGDRGGEPVVGLDQEKAAELMGRQISPQAVGKTWRTKVWPAMRNSLQDSDVARALLKNRQILQIIEEETRRRDDLHQKVRNIRHVGDEGRRASAARVAAKYAKQAQQLKQAWKLPPKQARLYHQLRKWAVQNWEEFRTEYGDLDTDAMAEGLAERAGYRYWADDPEHWVYEIAYDVERQVG